MELNEFKDRLFDILNETDALPITDIIFEDEENQIKLLLEDQSIFIITCRHSGTWSLSHQC